MNMFDDSPAEDNEVESLEKKLSYAIIERHAEEFQQQYQALFDPALPEDLRQLQKLMFCDENHSISHLNQTLAWGYTKIQDLKAILDERDLVNGYWRPRLAMPRLRESLSLTDGYTGLIQEIAGADPVPYTFVFTAQAPEQSRPDFYVCSEVLPQIDGNTGGATHLLTLRNLRIKPVCIRYLSQDSRWADADSFRQEALKLFSRRDRSPHPFKAMEIILRLRNALTIRSAQFGPVTRC